MKDLGMFGIRYKCEKLGNGKQLLQVVAGQEDLVI